jgi:hypothetical protein
MGKAALRMPMAYAAAELSASRAAIPRIGKFYGNIAKYSFSELSVNQNIELTS